MSKPSHVFATAAPGREVPIPTSEATAPGAALLRCFPGKVYRLPYSSYLRRRVISGDLILTGRAGSTAADLDAARADDPVETDETGALVAVSLPMPTPVPTPVPVPLMTFDMTDTESEKR